MTALILWWMRCALCAGLQPMEIDGYRKVFTEDQIVRAFSSDVKPLFPVSFWKGWPAQLAIRRQIRRWKRRVRFADGLCDVLDHALTGCAPKGCSGVRGSLSRPAAPFLLRQQNGARWTDPRDARAIANELATNDIHGCTDFTLQVLTVVVDHVRENRPLAFPEAVAELFRKGENGYSGAWCLSCRYRLNLAHFSECPLCGGKVGYSAIATDMSP